MAFQLVYTSVPAGLVAGRSGFSTVARHREIREALVSRIEAFSNVFDRGAQAAEDTLGLPVIHAFHHIRLGKADYHVLSRIRDSGSDYSGRVNHIAHNLVLEPGELESLRITPAEALLALEKKGFWLDKWDGGDPRYFDEGEREPLDGLAQSAELPAKHWKKATGSAATAALPCEAAAGERCHLVVESDATPVSILQLIAESQLVKDPQRRRPATLWDTSFTTHLQSSDDRASFQWSAVKKGSPAHGRLGRSKGAVIEIVPGLEAPSGDLATVAETGKIKQAPAEGAGTDAAGTGTGAAVPGMPLPPTRGVGIAVGEGIPLGGGPESDAEDYDDKIAAIMAGESEGSGGGFSLRRLWPWALVATIVALGAVLLVPRYLQKRESGALVAELNQKLGAGDWPGARVFYDGSVSKSEYSGVDALEEPFAALLAAEELMLFDSNLSSLSMSAGGFNDIGKKVNWNAANRKILKNLRISARGQLDAWLKFEGQLGEAWTGLQLAMLPFEKTPHLADPKKIAADSEALTTPSMTDLSAVLDHFTEEQATTSAYGTASEAIARISKARAKAERFGEIVTQVRKSKEPIPKGGDLSAEVEKLYGEMRELIGKVVNVASVEEIEKKDLQPIEDAFLKLAVGSGDFFEKAPPPAMVENNPPPKPVDDPKGSQPESAARPPALDWLPPTHLVAWREDHKYQIELSQEFKGSSAWSVVLPLVDLRPVSADQYPWIPAPASSTDLRVDLKKRPVFKRKLSGKALSLTGQSGGLVDLPIQGDFALRFGNPQAKDTPADYQVVFLRLEPPQGQAPRSEPLIEVPLDDGLERTLETNGAVLVRLRPSLLAALSKIVPGETLLKGATPVLRVELQSTLGSMPPSKALSAEHEFNFGALELALLNAGGSSGEKDQLAKALDEKKQEDARRQTFDSLFGVTTRKGKAGNDEAVAIPGEKLYQGISDVVDRVITNKDGSKRTVVEQRRKKLVGEMKPPAQAGAMPSIVDYLVVAVESVVNDRSRFNLRNKPTAGGEDEETARAILDEFVRTRGGWSTTGGGGYEGVRKALVAVREFAEKRPPGVTGPRNILGRDVQKDKKGNPKTNDKGKPIPEEWHTYMNRLRERQAIINTDLFFENWVKLFSEKNLDSIWPYFKSFETKAKTETDLQIATELERLNSILAEIDRREKNADQLTNAPLGKLGTWHLDLELPGTPNPNSPDAPKPYSIPLIRFTEQSAAAPTAPPAAADSATASISTLAPTPSGSAAAGEKGGGKSEDQAPEGEAGKP